MAWPETEQERDGDRHRRLEAEMRQAEANARAAREADRRAALKVDHSAEVALRQELTVRYPEASPQRIADMAARVRGVAQDAELQTMRAELNAEWQDAQAAKELDRKASLDRVGIALTPEERAAVDAALEPHANSELIAQSRAELAQRLAE